MNRIIWYPHMVFSLASHDSKCDSSWVEYLHHWPTCPLCFTEDYLQRSKQYMGAA